MRSVLWWFSSLSLVGALSSTVAAQPCPILADINTVGGPNGLSPMSSRSGRNYESRAQGYARCGSLYYFIGSTPETGNELWRTDGTAAGTQLAIDFVPGRGGSFLSLLSCFDLGQGPRLFFATRSSQLVISNGTPATTTVLGLVDSRSNLAQVGSLLLFAGISPPQTARPWLTDGTPAGTRVLSGNDLRFPREFTADAAGTTCYFSADHPTYGRELWRTDGTPSGTRLVRDIFAGTSGSNPAQFVYVNGRLVFEAADSLWSSDGTAAGTQPVVPDLDALDLRDGAVQGAFLYFTARSWKR